MTTLTSGHYEIDPMQDMAVPQAYLDATDLHNHPGSRRMPSYGPASPYTAEYAAAAAAHSRPVQWSPWAAGASYDSPVSQQPSQRYGAVPATSHWIDEIGSLYGLSGEDRPYSWYACADAQGVRPVSHAVEVDKRRYRPVSAPLPDAMNDVAAEGATMGLDHHLEDSPSMELEPLSPVAGGGTGGGGGGRGGGTARGGVWGPRSDTQDNWANPRPPHFHGYSWPSNDPVTPVSPSEEVITFGWGQPSKSSPMEQLHPYNWPTSATAAAGATAAAPKREPSLPALNTLSLQ